jgi:hypothetical protein
LEISEQTVEGRVGILAKSHNAVRVEARRPAAA